jgi:hypothetical protein
MITQILSQAALAIQHEDGQLLSECLNPYVPDSDLELVFQEISTLGGAQQVKDKAIRSKFQSGWQRVMEAYVTYLMSSQDDLYQNLSELLTYAILQKIDQQDLSH